MGAALLSFDLATPAGPRPILAPSGSEPSDVGHSSLFPMAPFANRIRNNRLIIAGRDVQPEPNTDDPLCLHGWAWQRAWQVARQAPDSCQLRMRLRDHGYDLTLTYEMYLSETALQLTLGAVNESAAPAPVGLGLHPYFPRGADTRISFAADKVWPDGPGHLPAGSRPISECDDYSAGRSLPPVWRNDCYSGWSGQARIQQPSLGYDLDLTARGTDVLMFYADPSLERFALEPQTHVSGETHTGSDGLLALAPGQDTRISLTLSVRPHAPNPAPQVPHAPD
ncbi:aldose 1-epimerase [Jannaschia sp. M317]|uniref:aldose 1-epimerase n=1 Tax=Jannaschia sp. M317 TaxID=2867011 RepID=UPI0021A81E2A|nr:aldose 1-epimerase [Jannaschia sp. M317]UWQ17939.1 aldose 1-epimerase [Jannaschia sp. M317]